MHELNRLFDGSICPKKLQKTSRHFGSLSHRKLTRGPLRDTNKYLTFPLSGKSCESTLIVVPNVLRLTLYYLSIWIPIPIESIIIEPAMLGSC